MILWVLLPQKTSHMVWCPNSHSYGLTSHVISSWEHTRASTSHARLLTGNSSYGRGWCALGGASFPQGLPELSEAMDDRVLHLTALRSNNCKSHLSESWAGEWSVSTGSFKATAHITRTENSPFSTGLSCICLLHYTIYLCKDRNENPQDR